MVSEPCVKHDEDGVEVGYLVVGEPEEGGVGKQPREAEVEAGDHETLALELNKAKALTLKQAWESGCWV